MTKKTRKTKTKKTAAAPKTAAVAAPAKAAPSPAATPETVSARAHQIWIAKGKPVPGAPLEDWLQAEREIGPLKT